MEPDVTSQTPAEEERQHHTYTTNRIPWYVHLMWISFWVLAIWYTAAYMVPAIREELFP